jgi:helicase SWR1
MDNSGPSSELGPVAGPSFQPVPTTSEIGSSNGRLARNGSVVRRNLRARPSEPSAIPSPITKRARSDTNTKLRPPTDKELDSINKALSEESLSAKRDGVIREKEAEVKRVVDGHDDAVREKFHLERFISIFEGWNPKVCTVHGSAIRI